MEYSLNMGRHKFIHLKNPKNCFTHNLFYSCNQNPSGEIEVVICYGNPKGLVLVPRIFYISSSMQANRQKTAMRYIFVLNVAYM
jgi:hypothetical protein